VLAKELVLQCGERKFQWDDLFENVGHISNDKLLNSPMLDMFLLKLKRNPFIDYETKGDRPISSSYQLSVVDQQHVRFHLVDAIQSTSDARATNSLDIVYAVLGLVENEEEANEIKVDYSLSACEVYCQAIQVIARYDSTSVGEYACSLMSEHPHHPLLFISSSRRKDCNGNCGTLEILRGWPWLVEKIMEETVQKDDFIWVWNGGFIR